MRRPIHTGGMPIADRTHFEDFSLDEFHAILGPKNPGLSHAVILVNSKKLLCCFDLHMDFSVGAMITQKRGRLSPTQQRSNGNSLSAGKAEANQRNRLKKTGISAIWQTESR